MSSAATNIIFNFADHGTGTGSGSDLGGRLSLHGAAFAIDPGSLISDNVQDLPPGTTTVTKNALAGELLPTKPIVTVNMDRVLQELVKPELPIDPTLRPRFIALQEWEGVVDEVRKEDFVARLTDITGRLRYPDEQAEFPKSEIREDDLELLIIGAVFRWTVGFQIHPTGTKERTSRVVFRRLPMWSVRDLKEADELADRLVGALNTSNSEVPQGGSSSGR